MNDSQPIHPTDPAHPPIRIERNPLKGRTLGEIVIDRADKRNALTPPMLHAMLEGTHELAADDKVQAIILRGEGETFCAGFDLTLCRDDVEALPSLLESLSRLIAALRAVPKPVVLGVQGAAIAGAAALLAAADLVIADTGAKFGYPVIRLGISPAVSAPSLAGAIGLGQARARLLNPELIDAQRAHELGWVHALVPVMEDVRPRAQIEAAKLADKPPHAFARTKAWINEIDHTSDHAMHEASLRASLSLVNSEEQQRLLERALRRG